MTTTVDFSRDTIRAVGLQYVYFKQKWQDSWTLYYDVHCLEATWALSPTMPTATLLSEYGYVKGLGTTTYTSTSKLNIIGWYVKVVMETNTLAGESNTWYGVVSHIEDEHKGIVTYGNVPLATGTQTIHCYGLEKLLDTEFLAESWVDVGNESPMVVQLPITFNANGRPNRNDRLLSPNDSWAFEGRVLGTSPTLRPTALWWSSGDIVDYLLSWAVPKESFRTRNARIPFRLIDSWNIPILDEPELHQEGHTVLSLLNRLIDRRRLRSFYLEVDTSVDPNIIQVHVVPWNKEVIDTGIAGADVLLENTSLLNLKYDYNQSTTASIRTSRVQRYDRVLVRGARRTSTATFVVDTPYLNPVWTTTEETAYEAAASGVTGYAGWDRLQQQQRNNEVRHSPELSAVYSWFKLLDTWNLKTVLVAGTAESPVFLKDDGLAETEEYIHAIVFEPWVPLYEHVDYSGDKIAKETAAKPAIYVYRQPQVYFNIPTDNRWIAGDAISTLMEATGDATDDGRNFRWSAYVRTQPESRTLEIRVSNEPQHVIAMTDFTALTEDRVLGKFDYRSKKMAVTATLRDNRYAEGKYPVDGKNDSTLIDAQYGLVVYAGDSFRQDYVCPATIIDVETDGTLIYSEGGYVRDDTDLLKALARVTYEWWNQDRVILTLATTQLTSSIQIGDFIVAVGDSAVPNNGHYTQVNTLVSELRITWPRLEGNQVAGPVMEIVTGAGELDPMTLAPKDPSKRTISRAKARVVR